MNRLNYFTITLIVIVVLQNCRPKDIDIKVKPAPVKVAVSSLVFRDISTNLMVVFLSRSFSALEANKRTDSLSQEDLDKILVNNATVSIKRNGISYPLEFLDGGIYSSFELPLLEGDSYELYVMDPQTGKEIIATTVMQPYYRFDTIYPYKRVNGRDTSSYVYFELSDNPQQENYYVVNYVRQGERISVGGGRRINVNRAVSGNVNAIETNFDLLSDASFSNGKYTADKLLRQTGPSDTVAVSVASISKGYYEFLTAFKRTGTLLNTLTGEPITYPSNVKNGYGYFNAYIPQVKLFYLREH